VNLAIAGRMRTAERPRRSFRSDTPLLDFRIGSVGDQYEREARWIPMLAHVLVGEPIPLRARHALVWNCSSDNFVTSILDRSQPSTKLRLKNARFARFLAGMPSSTPAAAAFLPFSVA
jgi:hypothetical protein